MVDRELQENMGEKELVELSQAHLRKLKNRLIYKYDKENNNANKQNGSEIDLTTGTLPIEFLFVKA